MLFYPGRYILTFDQSGLSNLDWASVSASAPSRVKVWLNGELVEDVFVGAYSPHTWWSHNSLFKPQGPTDKIEIEVGSHAVLRIEGNLVCV